MAIGSGLAAQVGHKAETVYGTPVTVDRFLEFLSETFDSQVEKIYAKGLGSARFQRSTHVVTNLIGAGGDIEFEVFTKGYGTLLKQCLGGGVSAQVGGTAEYTQTFTPDTGGLAGISDTVQIGKPDTGGTVRAFTYEGCKVTGWELSAALGETVRLKTTWDCENVLTATALATASYASGRAPFVYSQGALLVGGVANIVKAFSVAGDNALDTDRRGIGAIQKREPIANEEMPITGSFDAEFVDLTNYSAFIAGTQAALSLIFTGGTIPTTSNPYKLTITIPLIELTAEGPKVGGPDIVRQNMEFKALQSGASALITIVINTDDAAL